MKFYKYLTIIFSIIVMNFAHAELKTFGVPDEPQTDETPSQEGLPDEGTPEESSAEDSNPEESNPEEGTPEEGNDMSSATDDSVIGEDQPVKFKEEYVLSMDLSLPVYTGSNLESRFDNGLSFGFEVSTPFAFEVAGQNISVSAQLVLNSLTANDNSANTGTSDYTPMLLGAKLNSEVSVLDVSLSTGLAMASGDVRTGEDYSMTSLYAGAGLGYSLSFKSLSFMPEPMKGMSLRLGADLRMIFGSPDDTGDSSNLINIGMSLGYPLFF